MKVLQVASGDLWAGAEVQFFYLCRQLRRQGVDVHAVLFNEGILAERLRGEGVPLTVFPESRLSAPQLFRCFADHLKVLAPQLIHTHRYKENILVSLANLLTARAVCVRTVHGGQEIHAPWWRIHQHAIRYLNVFCGRYLQQAIIAVSAELGDSLRPVYGHGKLHVIENAIDVDYVDGLARRPPAVAVNADTFNIAIVGRLVPVKRHDLLLAALKQLRAAGEDNWRLFVIGDGPLKAAMEALSVEYGLTDVVQFTGAVDPVYPLLARMDLLVMPSDHEGLPMTLLESMALQVPVVAHRIGGIPVVVGDGQYATLVDAHSPEGYREAIAAIMHDAAGRSMKARDARNHVRASYDVAAKTSAFVALYRQLLHA